MTIALAILAVGAAVLVVRSARSSPTSVSLPPAGNRFAIIDGRRVLVHVPAKLRRMRTVLYFHGFGGNIDTLLKQLVPILDAASDPAILVIPQLGPKSEIGSLANSGAMKRLLQNSVFGSLSGKIDVLSHSGGYHGAAAAIRDLPVSSVGLLDSLYGEMSTFEMFTKKISTKHFANVYGPTTRDASLLLASDISSALDTALSTIPNQRLLRLKVSTQATGIPHTEVPAVYGAAMIDAFS